MVSQHLTQRLEFLCGVGDAGGVGGAVDDKQAGPGGNGCFQLLRSDLESGFDPRPNDHRFAICQPDHVRVGYPVGRRDDDLIAGVEQRLDEIEKTLLAPAGDEDLFRPVFQAIVTPEFRYNRALELRSTINGGIARKSGVNGRDGRRPDVLGGIEIRFAGPEPDDVLAGSAQLGDPRRHRQGRGGFDALYPVREPDLVQNCYPVV